MRRAFAWGVNAYPTAPLQGCVNDVKDLAEYLMVYQGWQPEEIRLLTDERATKHEIIQRLAWLVSDLQPGDVALYHESRHGAKVATRKPDSGEIDGYDEVACPVEFDWSPETYIVDDSFLGFMAAVPDGVTFLWISDSCYSGGLSRVMPLAAGKPRRPRSIRQPVDMQWRAMTAERRGMRARKIGGALRNVLLLAACTEDQEASDAYFGWRWNGALTWHLLHLLKKGAEQLPMKDLVKVLAENLRKDGFDQTPELLGSEEAMERAFLQAIV